MNEGKRKRRNELFTVGGEGGKQPPPPFAEVDVAAANVEKFGRSKNPGRPQVMVNLRVSSVPLASCPEGRSIKAFARGPTRP